MTKRPKGAGKIIQWDGKVITKPGIYKGISLELYHSADLFGDVPAISSSGLRKMWKAPAYYWAESPYNPQRVEQADKKHFVLGRAVHHVILGEPHFQRMFVTRPAEYPDAKSGELKPWNGNANYCKAWMAANSGGRTVLTPEQVEQIMGMALSLGKHPLVRQGILNGSIENSYFWRDKETGIWLKWRPDTTPLDSADFVDMKTTQDVSSWVGLQRIIEDLGYHQQGGLGRTACHELLGREMASFALFFVEVNNPWCARLLDVKAETLKLGERMNRAMVRAFWKCWKDKHWPGPAEADVEHIEINERAHERAELILKTVHGV